MDIDILDKPHTNMREAYKVTYIPRLCYSCHYSVSPRNLDGYLDIPPLLCLLFLPTAVFEAFQIYVRASTIIIYLNNLNKNNSNQYIFTTETLKSNHVTAGSHQLIKKNQILKY